MVLSIFVPSTQPFTDLGATRLGVLFLRHGREAELEADRLGVEYGAGAGYDPTGVPRFLATLARVSALSERGMPNWLSTHPDPGLRVTRAGPVAGQFGSPDAKKVNHDPYLDRIQGLVFGDSPKDGIVRGNEFLHPLLRIGVTFPDGWELTNTPEAVMAQEPGTQHFMVLQEAEATLRQGDPARLRNRSGTSRSRRCEKPATPRLKARCSGSTATTRMSASIARNAKGARRVCDARGPHRRRAGSFTVVAGFAPEKPSSSLGDRDIRAAPAERSASSRRRRRRTSARTASTSTSSHQADSWQSIARHARSKIRQRHDARDHERPRLERAAAARRSRQDRRRGRRIGGSSAKRRSRSIWRTIARASSSPACCFSARHLHLPDAARRPGAREVIPVPPRVHAAAPRRGARPQPQLLHPQSVPYSHDLASAAERGARHRRRGFLRSRRRRSRGDQGFVTRTGEEHFPARRQHHHAAAGQESLPLAVTKSDAQGQGALDHATARGRAHQAAHLRDLPEHDRVGGRDSAARRRRAPTSGSPARLSTSRKRR